MPDTPNPEGPPPIGCLLNNGSVVVVATHLHEEGNGWLSSGVLLACRNEEPHPYVVWDYAIRRGAYDCGQGDYCSSLEEAIRCFKNRRGEIDA